MEQKRSNSLNIVDTEQFGEAKKLFFLDIRLAKNQRHYLTITSLRREMDEAYTRKQIILFDHELPFFVEAMTMLLGRYANGNLGESC